MAAERINAHDAHRVLYSNPDALLVCAYDDAEKCRTYHLDGAITLDEFRSRVGSIPKDAAIIFY